MSNKAEPAAKGVKPKYPALAAVVGVACCALLIPEVQQSEGRRLVPYQDVVGVWTDCDGNTKNVVPGQAQTEAQCDAKLEANLIAHAQPVIACVPGIKDRPGVLAAGASFAYNFGAKRACAWSPFQLFRAGRWAEGCLAFVRFNGTIGAAPARGAMESRRILSGPNKGQYFNVWKGLDRRRKRERDLCLRDAR